MAIQQCEDINAVQDVTTSDDVQEGLIAVSTWIDAMTPSHDTGKLFATYLDHCPIRNQDFTNSYSRFKATK